MLNSEMLYFRTIIIVRKLAYYKLNECSEGYVYTPQVKQLKPHEVNITSKIHNVCQRDFFLCCYTGI